ncbi:MAG: hypothetical protein ABID09_00930, partial [Candidatus Omnitrophota bacterium]
TKEKGSLYQVGVAVNKGKIGIFLKSYQLSKIGLYLTRGNTGLSFNPSRNKIALTFPKGQRAKIEQSEHISVSPCDKGYFMTFIQNGKRADNLMGAVSKDLKKFTVTGKISTAQEKGTLVPNYKHDGRYVMYLGESFIYTATSKDLKKWKISDISCLTPRIDSFDHAPLSVLAVSLTPHGLLVVYDASYKEYGRQTLQIGGALFSLSDPNDIIWRSEEPLYAETLPAGSEDVYSLGAAFYKEKIFLYFISKTRKLMTVSIPKPFPSARDKQALVCLKRFYKNPIIVPNTTNEWESEGTFNPAALYDDGKVHLLYRAVGKSGISCFGYASSRDGFHIEKNLSEPAYVPRKSFEGIHTKPAQRMDLFKSGCGWGGCEDPKLTAIDNRIYLTYVAFNGYSPPRIALSSIGRSDFLQKRWRWEEPILISPPGVVDKSGCILPEKVKGQYVIFHRIFPHILIDYRDELKFDNGRWLQAKHKITARKNMWDSRKLSIGATPIKTDEGWLVIYHAVDDRDDTRYKIGAMILDLEDPSKVLYRTSNPILEPDEPYENDWKPGIVYPCGAVVIGQELFVYYGGGDKVVCCATAQLDQFVKAIKKDKPVSYMVREVVYS